MTESQSSSRIEYYLSHSWGISEGSRDRISKLLRIADTVKADRLLDIGCSTGTLSLQIKQVTGAREVYGVDISPEVISEANNKGIKAAQLDIENSPLPFEDNFFDFIFCGDVNEHVFNPSDLLSEVERVLRPNGSFLLTTPNLASWYNRVVLPLGYQPFETAVSLNYPKAGKLKFGTHSGDRSVPDLGGEHVRVMTLKALIELLRLHNFEIITIRGAHGTLSQTSVLSYFIQVIDRMMSVFPSMATWLVVQAAKR